MDGWKRLLGSIPTRQRILIVAAALLVAAGLFGVSKYRREQDFKPLYTGMAAEDAGANAQG